MKICFLTNGVHNSRLFDTYRKMTPGRTGKWRDMEGISRLDDIIAIAESDYCVVIDKYDEHKIPKDKKILLGAHPTIPGHQWFNFNTDEAAIKIDLTNTCGLGEWWLDEDYDTLSDFSRPHKSKSLTCILSNQNNQSYHKQRLRFMMEYCNKWPDTLDLYGRIKPVGSMIPFYRGELGTETPQTYWFGKGAALKDYRYALEFDAGPCRNYFSERVYDALLMWCKPIYWGGTNIEEYLPRKAFEYFNIDGDGSDIVEAAKEPVDYQAIAEARNLLLNKWQIWPRIYGAIRG